MWPFEERQETNAEKLARIEATERQNYAEDLITEASAIMVELDQKADNSDHPMVQEKITDARKLYIKMDLRMNIIRDYLSTKELDKWNYLKAGRKVKVMEDELNRLKCMRKEFTELLPGDSSLSHQYDDQCAGLVQQIAALQEQVAFLQQVQPCFVNDADNQVCLVSNGSVSI